MIRHGFRTGRSAHDAQKLLFINLNSGAKGIEKRVIELDIEKCFDRISHTSIMERLIAPMGIKTGIFRCLKAGVNPEFPEQGTPQGGVISPLLANIALNGIEEIHQSIRYADDMVIILKPQDDAMAILDKVSEFPAERGMKVSEKKTKLTATTDGFDFLGWHFRVQSNGKFRCVPCGKLHQTLAPVNVATVIEAAIDRVQPQVQAKQIRLNAQLRIAQQISGDCNRLEQIVVNLLTNAIKFTPEQGQIDIELTQVS